jgi:hypothetical protein
MWELYMQKIQPFKDETKDVLLKEPGHTVQ